MPLPDLSPAGFEFGLAAALGAVLAAAGGAKLLNLELTRISLGRLAGKGHRFGRTTLTAGAGALGVGEIGLGVVLLAAPALPPAAGTASAALAVAACAAFIVVIRRAQRLGAACGCFGSFSVRVPGRMETARAVSLLAVATTSFGLRLWRPDAPVMLSGWLLGALVAAAVVAGAMIATGPNRSVRDLLTALRPAGAADLRVAGPLRRRRILRQVRAAGPVREVVDRLGSEPPWHRAQVRVTGRPVRLASVIVVDGPVRFQVVAPTTGPVAVVCYTPTGVLTPNRPAPAAAPTRPPPPPPPKVPTPG